MVIKQTKRKNITSEYFLIQCACCDIMFYARASRVYGNAPMFYNRAHYLRKFSGITGPLTKEDLASSKCTEPGGNVVWLEGHLPFVLKENYVSDKTLALRLLREDIQKREQHLPRRSKTFL